MMGKCGQLRFSRRGIAVIDTAIEAQKQFAGFTMCCQIAGALLKKGESTWMDKTAGAPITRK
jgi:hypothetical protein